MGEGLIDGALLIHMVCWCADVVIEAKGLICFQLGPTSVCQLPWQQAATSKPVDYIQGLQPKMIKIAVKHR